MVQTQEEKAATDPNQKSTAIDLIDCNRIQSNSIQSNPIQSSIPFDERKNDQTQSVVFVCGVG
jgi:hypothetical protein